MANEVLVKQGSAISWMQSGGTEPISLNGLTDTSARQGDKADLGATRAADFAMVVVMDVNVAPTAGEPIQIYWAASPSATGDNPAGTGDSDAAFSTPGEYAFQLMHIGTIYCANTTDDQRQVFRFSPPLRYGMPVVWNNSGQTLASAGNSEIIIYPITDEVQ